MSTQILKGLRVLDLGHMISGAYCTMHLADHGAEVIKIEDGGGDSPRDAAPELALADYFISLNRGKKSIRIDLETQEGKAAFLRLVTTADVIVENYGPGVMENLGLTYETLAADNPGLVYAAIRGLGDSRTGASPESDKPPSDALALAVGRLMVTTGTDADSIANSDTGIGDIFAGMMMAFGIMAALREAEATGKGQCVDIDMNDAMISLCERMAHHQDATGAVPHQQSGTLAPNPLRFAAHDHDAPALPSALGAHDAMLDELTPAAAPDPEAKRALRNAFGTFATGVTVVTTREPGGTPRGFTANSFTSVSLEPPLLLVCIAKAALSCDTFAQADHFAVNILADDQKEISGLFASQSAEKFDIAEWQVDAQDVPLIDGALASFSCARHRLVDAGDHLILIGRVLEFDTHEGAPLGYYKGAYFDVGLNEALADAAASARSVSVAAVLVREGQVLLHRDQEGHVSLPTAPAKTNTVGGLTAHLKSLGLTPALDHLYAVYQHSQNGSQRIVYHGVVDGEAPAGLQYFALNALPFDQVADEAERAMLRRYHQENQHGAFGIYHGNEVEGVVHAVAGRRSYHI